MHHHCHRVAYQQDVNVGLINLRRDGAPAKLILDTVNTQELRMYNVDAVPG